MVERTARATELGTCISATCVARHARPHSSMEGQHDGLPYTDRGTEGAEEIAIRPMTHGTHGSA